MPARTQALTARTGRAPWGSQPPLARPLVFSDPVPILEAASCPTPLTRLRSNVHNQEPDSRLALVPPGLVSESCSPGSASTAGFLQIGASVLLSPTRHCLPASSLVRPPRTGSLHTPAPASLRQCGPPPAPTALLSVGLGTQKESTGGDTCGSASSQRPATTTYPIAGFPSSS